MHKHTLWYKLQRSHLQALLIVVFHVETNRSPQGDVAPVKYPVDDITGHSWPLCGETQQNMPSPCVSDGNAYHHAIRQPQYVTCLNWPRSHLQPARMWPKNKLTISPGSSHSLATQCGQRGCMGVALLPLETKWRWTSGMPVARMWAPVLSWDALPRQWFPEYQVLGNPPWFS